MLRLVKRIVIVLRVVIYFGIWKAMLNAAATAGFYGGWVASAVTVGFLVLVLVSEHTLSPWLEEWIHRWFFPGVSRFLGVLDQFSQALSRLLEFDSLLEKMRQFLVEAFTAGEAFFYLNTETAFEWLELEGVAIQPPLILELSLGDSRCTLFQQPVRFHRVEELFYLHPECHQLLRPLRPQFKEWVFLPVKGPRRASGFFLFHPRAYRLLTLPEVKQPFLELVPRLADAIENAHVHSEIKRRSLESALLLRIVKQITATLNLQEVLENIIDSVSQLVRYDAAAIFLVDHKHRLLRHMVTRGYDRTLLDRVPLKLHEGISGWVVQTRQPIIIPDVSKDTHYFAVRPQTRSQITVPLFKGESVIGALVLESDQYNYFTYDDLELLNSFASLAAIAIANAQLYEDSLKKRQLESELLVASSVQRALLPERPPSFPGLSLHAVNIPSRFVGGDLYDIVRIDSERLGLAIGDVSGKGAPGAILMAMLYAGFKSIFREIYQVAEIVARLNNFMVQTTMEGYFATFFLAIYQRKTRTLTYCNAGHNPPILLDNQKSVHFLEEGGTVLGFLPDLNYRQHSLRIEPGSYLVLYTDGVNEVKNRRGEEYGEKRLVRVLRRHWGEHPRQMSEAVLRSIRRFGGSTEFQDDLTLVIARFEEETEHAL